MKTKMRKIGTITVTVLLSLALLTNIIPLFAPTEAAGNSTPTSFMEYSNAYATAIVPIPSIGNITAMAIAAAHQHKSSTIDNYEVISIILSTRLPTGSVASVTAAITTNFNEEDLSWRKAVRNGTSQYTEVNGVVTINNILRVTANELRVVKTGNRTTVDFEPKTPVAITLPRDQFPAANFSATWNVPAFHVDLDVNGSATVGNSTSTNPSGWSEYNEYVNYNANFTFSCLSWNNYINSGNLGTYIRSFNAHRGSAPGVPVSPSDPLKTVDLYNFGQAGFNISGIGGMSRMQINALHDIQGTMGTPDVIQVNLTAAGIIGYVQASIATNPSPQASKWIRAVVNGTSTYTEVNGNVIIDNQFLVSPNELRVQLNGTRLTVNFAPTTPLNVTLPPDVFPRANFPSTLSLPAFTVEFNWVTIPNVSYMILSSSVLQLSGWRQINDFALGYAGATLNVPAWNLTTTVAGSTTYFFPYMVTTLYSPDLPKPVAATAFTSVTVLPGWTWWFFVHGNGGVGPHTYQWYEGMTLLQGQTSMILPVTKTAPGTYTFYCKVIDSQGTTTNSNSVTLRVIS